MNAKPTSILSPRQAKLAGAISAAGGAVDDLVRRLLEQGLHPMAVMAALLDGYVAVANSGGAGGALSGLRGLAAAQGELLDTLAARPQGVKTTGDALPRTGPASPYTAPGAPERTPPGG